MRSGHPAIHRLRWWVEQDRPVVDHDCVDRERVRATLPHPTWVLLGDHVEPSFHCLACGCHGFLNPSTRETDDERQIRHTHESVVRPRGEATDATLPEEPQPRGVPTTRYPKRCDNPLAHANHDQCPGRSFDQT